MLWQCSICGEFTADTRERLLNHIGRCHGNDPNFHIVCYGGPDATAQKTVFVFLHFCIFDFFIFFIFLFFYFFIFCFFDF